MAGKSKFPFDRKFGIETFFFDDYCKKEFCENPDETLFCCCPLRFLFASDPNELPPLFEFLSTVPVVDILKLLPDT